MKQRALLLAWIIVSIPASGVFAQATKQAQSKAAAPAAVQARKDTVAAPGEKAAASGKAVAVPSDSSAHAQNKAVADSSAKAAIPDSVAVEDPLTYSRPVFNYDPGGRRDPFNSLVPKENKDEKKIKSLFNYEKAFLRGVVRTEFSVYALVIDTDNYAHVLRKNDRVLNGYVTDITDDAVYLHIVQFGRSMRIILRMETARQTVKSEESGLDLVKRPGINITYEQGDFTGADISVDDVVLPSAEITTIEEEWFGSETKQSVSSGESGASTLIAPREGSEVIFPQLFRWVKSNGDSLYTVVFSQDDQFRSQLVVKEGIASSSYLFENNPGLETGKRYFWKVVAMKRSGNWVNSRNHLSFVITDTIVRGTADEKR